MGGSIATRKSSVQHPFKLQRLFSAKFRFRLFNGEGIVLLRRIQPSLLRTHIEHTVCSPKRIGADEREFSSAISGQASPHR